MVLLQINSDDISDCDLSKEAELILEMYRRETLEDLQRYYRNDLGLWNFSTRLGNLMTANHAVQVLSCFLKY